MAFYGTGMMTIAIREAERRSQIAFATAKNDTLEAYWAALEAIES